MRESAVVRLLGLRVRIPPGGGVAWMSVVIVLSGRGSVRRTDHSSREVLRSVMCLVCVIAKPPKGRPWPGIRSKYHRKKKMNLP